MEPAKIRPWKSFANLEQWIERNCTNCRHLENDPPDGADCRPCPLPYQAYVSLLRETEPSRTVFGTLKTNLPKGKPNDNYTAPWSCPSRHDTRGRKRKLSQAQETC